MAPGDERNRPSDARCADSPRASHPAYASIRAKLCYKLFPLSAWSGFEITARIVLCKPAPEMPARANAAETLRPAIFQQVGAFDSRRAFARIQRIRQRQCHFLPPLKPYLTSSVPIAYAAVGVPLAPSNRSQVNLRCFHNLLMLSRT